MFSLIYNDVPPIEPIFGRKLNIDNFVLEVLKSTGNGITLKP